MDLTDAQWAVFEPTFRPRRRPDRRRPWTDARAVLNGVLCVLRTGARRGTTCRGAIRPTKPATAAFSSGNAAAGSIDCCNGSRKISATAAKSISVRPFVDSIPIRPRQGFSIGDCSAFMATHQLAA
jgi:hypothetical protein